MQTWEELKIDALVRLPETLDLEAAGMAHARAALPLSHGAHCGTAPQRTKGSRHCGADCTMPPAIRHWEVYGQGPKKRTPDGNVT